jgi:hypothetical protein
MSDEGGHHSVVRCTKAGALRRETRKVWHLPDVEKFRYTGPDWLILLLSSVSKDDISQDLNEKELKKG